MNVVVGDEALEFAGIHVGLAAGTRGWACGGLSGGNAQNSVEITGGQFALRIFGVNVADGIDIAGIEPAVGRFGGAELEVVAVELAEIIGAVGAGENGFDAAEGVELAEGGAGAAGLRGRRGWGRVRRGEMKIERVGVELNLLSFDGD